MSGRPSGATRAGPGPLEVSFTFQPGNGRSTTDQLADLQDRIRSPERLVTAIREEVIALEREAVGEGELSQALAHFDPIWESLSPREQSRIIRVLVERIGYDGVTAR